jgi:hypothetical protein
MSALPLDVAPLLLEFNVGPLTLTRAGASTKNQFGEYVEGATSPIVLDPVAAYPTTPAELKLEPEASRSDDDRTTFVAGVALQRGADVIAYRGRNWRLMFLLDNGLQGAVWRAIGVAAEA